MLKHYIDNLEKLVINEKREIALRVLEAGIKAIDTEEIINANIFLSGDFLYIKEEKFDLSKFKNIKIVGFGKSSVLAASVLEKILGNKITVGAVIGLEERKLNFIKTFKGTHPRPSIENVEAGNEIYRIISDSKEDDLIIVLVSGGGSALLCYPDTECESGARLYDSFLKVGGTISKMNVIRKHLSLLKGGGLAKVAYPATIVGLIFSDVPGDVFSDVASGPTYKDISTISDVEKIIKKNNLGDFKLLETPKEEKYFKKVHNFVLVSNRTALGAMKIKAKELGLKVKIISYDLYDPMKNVLEKMFKKNNLFFLEALFGKKEMQIILAAGEPKIAIKNSSGKGGRNTHLTLLALKKIDKNSLFISFASDGLDNTDMAGAIADSSTFNKAQEKGLNIDEYLENFDSYNFFEKTEDLIKTGPTGANVSDLMIFIKEG